MVGFNNIPTDIRVPLFYAEVDNSQASYFSRQSKTLLIGQMLVDGTGEAGKPVLVSRTDEARTLFGIGSMLARMHEFYRKNDDFGEVWCIPLHDDEASAKATGTIEINGQVTASGTLSLYIAGQVIRAAAISGETGATVAGTLIGKINAVDTLPVIASLEDGAVKVTARHAGALGNDVTLFLNYRGLMGGEETPLGLTVTITPMAGGTSAPDLGAVIAVLGDEEYDHIIQPYTDTASLDLFKEEMGDITGRWSWSRQIYGHVYSAKRGSLSDLVAFGRLRNDQHATIAGMERQIPAPVWEYVAAYGARCARFLNDDPSRPTQTGELLGILAAPSEARFILTERQTLLSAGIATSFTGAGTVRIERSITTYQKNAWNQPDPSYLDIEPLFQLAYILRFLKQRITQKYGRHALANDGTRFGAGRAIVTPKVIKAELIAAYGELERLGMVENAVAFRENLIVERDATNPNRLNVLYPPDLVNQLRFFALLAQFRLQYPETA